MSSLWLCNMMHTCILLPFVFVDNLCTIFMWILNSGRAFLAQTWMSIRTNTHTRMHMPTVMFLSVLRDTELIKSKNWPQVKSNYKERTLKNLFYDTRYALEFLLQKHVLATKLVFGMWQVSYLSALRNSLPISRYMIQSDCRSSGTATSSGSCSRKKY